MTIKQAIVQQALTLIKPQMVVGFGGGSTVGELVKEAANHVNEITVVTPSPTTRQLATVLGYTVVDTAYCDRVDIAFDDCDQLDHHGNALKSGGGIHANEKIIASLADEYWLLTMRDRLVDQFDIKTPLVLEVLPAALSLVMRTVSDLGGQATLRVADNRDGFTLTDNGNLLIDCHFPTYAKLTALNAELATLAGVVETSYFDHLVTNAWLGDAATNTVEALF
ncbi:ribose 5-phosphate isomerase A [Lactiplantibacillus paraplantarum]|uniref:ribose 5-phosphate isomerase A n=1 Tax=Lactiplantibacillus paraplantarum TaxID=60520 RepID=UPI000513CA8A|nr:ribose 5-phosphate isomerase A [Lactiplantibacillus paraplantarum]OAX73377.1 ribose-5-phosphate isomerase [Lactiplantibacillus plantarum]ALO03194.1 ribonucleotide-diphosphate reductase subunit alpha [Lactiplantibacillus paraplantarum]KGE75147.1 ribonucleotide-diphosphate reductase subunit alpha [Lactiplantibacillus paraplantarum]MCW1909166.1 ribose 5-phosphate isomerase A [Lactiplantibacillus paraplantarum]RDG11580.1 ribose 5-phosphate isomerase A [Lactiplantibacillus paraplantarum]